MSTKIRETKDYPSYEKPKARPKSTPKNVHHIPTKKNNSKSVDNDLFFEILSIAALVLSFFLILSIYTTDGGGAIGQFISSITKGLFGFGAYIIPLVIIALSVYVLITGKRNFDSFNIYTSMVLFMTVISFFHIVGIGELPVYESPSALIADNYRSGSFSNGGLFGAIFGMFFLKLIGAPATYLILITIMIISGMLLTGRSFVGGVKKGQSYIKSKVDNSEVVKKIKKDKMMQKNKTFNHVIKNIEHSTDEDEIHIITTRGKKITRDALYPLKKNTTLDVEKEKHIIERSSKKEIKDEYFIEAPKLNFDIILDDDDDDTDIVNTKKVKKETIDIENEYEDDAIELEDYEMEYEDNTVEYSKYEETEYDDKEDEYEYEEDEHIPTIIAAKSSKPVSRIEIDKVYQFPHIDFLNENPNTENTISKSQILENSKKLEETLKSFGVSATVIEVSKGPAVTRYELSPGQGVKVSKISGLADDLALNLAASGIRIEAPIPGKAAVGIEVPNDEVKAVYLKEVLAVEDFQKFPSGLSFALGKDIAGNTVITDIAKMPHLLIAGSTGSGKSVCINTLITSIIYKSSPDQVKLLMVDPKVVELSVYNGIPHLLIPVVTDPKKAAGALNWAVKEMISRYKCFADTSVRDLKGYNKYLEENGHKPLPQIVIIVDELADLMMVAQNEVEDAICRLAQMARAAGIHLVIATQRPSVDVITGLIKANIPSRIAFAVSSGTDSRTILDMTGAERLLGKGDMLFYPVGMNKPLRVQGAFISDKEVENIVSFLKQNNTNHYDENMIEQITSSGTKGDADGEVDDLFVEAMNFIVQKEKASISLIQRKFRIGYNRAARLIEDLEERGFIDAGDGSKPRKVLLDKIEWEDYKERNNL